MTKASPTVLSAFHEFLADLRMKRSANTARAYALGLKCFEYSLQQDKIPATSPLGALSIEHIIEFPHYLAMMGYSKKTTGVYAASVKKFLDWLVIQGVMEPAYAEGVRITAAYKDLALKKEEKLPRWPEENDVPNMLTAVRTLKYKSPILERDIAVVEFLASSGCRNAEACGMLVGDINMRAHKAKVVGKGNVERIVYFSTPTHDAFRSYWVARRNSDPNAPAFARHDDGAGKHWEAITTQTVRDVVMSAMALAGIEPHKFSPHYFRHAFAMRMLKETGNLALVQDLLGHKDPKTTRGYAKIKLDELQKAHREIYG